MRQVRTVVIAPTLDTSVYASGDQVSTLQNVDVISPSRRGGEIKLVTVMDGALQKSPLDLFFFDRSVTLAADNAAASMTDANMAFCLGVINVLETNYDDTALNSIATVAVDFPIMAADTGRRIYMAIVSRGTPTYAATSLSIRISAVLEEN